MRRMDAKIVTLFQKRARRRRELNKDEDLLYPETMHNK